MKYSPYQTYKNSGIQWINKVPSSWEISKIKWHSRVYSGVDSPCIDGEYPLIGANGVIGSSDTYSLKEDTVLMGRVGSAGLINYITSKSGVSDNALIFSNFPSVDTRYLYYFLLSDNFELDISKTAQPLITASRVKEHFICIPSPVEQKAITNFLDRETANIDELIQKQEKLINLYSEKINTIVLDGLANSKTKYIRLMHASDVISRPISQENDSSYKPLGLYNRGRGIFIKEERDAEDMGDSDFFWIKPGDLIFSGQFAWEGAVAMAQLEHDGCVVSHRYPVIRGKEGVALTEYLLALFHTSHGDFLLNENSRGAAGRNRPLNISLLLKEKIPIIDMQSQLKIRRLIELKKQFLRKALQEIALLKEHRSSLISEAVTGKIDVRELV